MATNDLTHDEYDSLACAFGWFNETLFDGSLPDCLITLARMPGARGYFWHEKFIRRYGKRFSHEIALNPDTFRHRTDREILSTLVHEMVHLWQAAFGKPGRGGYHNRQWAEKMESIGLLPTSTGRRGGKRTGDHMTHMIIDGGPFANSFHELRKTGVRLRWESLPVLSRGSDRSKCKFSCPKCGINVWGKASLEGKIGCLPCEIAIEFV